MSARLVLLCASLALGACSVTPDYRSPDSAAYLGERYVEARSDTPRQTLDQVAWWKRFDDAAIDRLVQQALENNLDLRVAAANVLESQALLRAATGRRWPELSAAASGDRSFTGSTTRPDGSTSGDRSSTTTLQLGASVAWQADLFGRLRSAERASLADWQATRTDREALIHTVIADVIRQRVQLAIALQRLLVAEDILANRERTLEIVERRYNRGVSNTSAVDVRLARENVYSAQAGIAALEQEVALAQHALDILIGQKPGASPVTREDLDPLPTLDDAIAGVPAQLLDRRPDLRAAEFRVIAANERVGVAIADLYPDLVISASGGWREENLSDLLNPDALFASLLGELTQTLFAGGRLRAEVDAAEARLQAQAGSYANQVLQAIGEVEDALVSNRQLRERLARVNQQVTEARLAGELSRERYARGVENLLTVLETERRRQDAEDSLLRVEQDYWNARVDLHLALGGDWLDQPHQQAVAANKNR